MTRGLVTGVARGGATHNSIKLVVTPELQVMLLMLLRLMLLVGMIISFACQVRNIILWAPLFLRDFCLWRDRCCNLPSCLTFGHGNPEHVFM